MTKRDLASLMVGRDVLFRLEKPPANLGEERLILSDVEALDDKGLSALRKLSLTVRSGEIVGIAGVAGNGQRELAETICGLRPTTGGTIRVATNPVTNAPPIIMIEPASPMCQRTAAPPAARLTSPWPKTWRSKATASPASAGGCS